MDVNQLAGPVNDKGSEGRVVKHTTYSSDDEVVAVMDRSNSNSYADGAGTIGDGGTMEMVEKSFEPCRWGMP